MLKRRSSKGMNPTMAGIMGTFQTLWVYYRPPDFVANGDCMELGRRGDQPSERWGVPALRPQRNESSDRMNARGIGVAASARDDRHDSGLSG